MNQELCTGKLALLITPWGWAVSIGTLLIRSTYQLPLVSSSEAWGEQTYRWNLPSLKCFLLPCTAQAPCATAHNLHSSLFCLKDNFTPEDKSPLSFTSISPQSILMLHCLYLCLPLCAGTLVRCTGWRKRGEQNA